MELRTQSWHAVLTGVGMVSVLVFSGCGDGAVGPREKTYSGELVPVKGVITLDGEPLADANVNFVFDGTPPEGFMRGEGKTDSSGKYQLRSSGKLGVPPGRYRIGIEKWGTPDGSPFREDPANGMDIEQAKMAGKVKQLVPGKYNDPMKGQLSIEITEGENEPANFDLKSK